GDVSGYIEVSRRLWTGAGAGFDSGTAGGALPDGRNPDGCARAGFDSGIVRCGGSGVYGGTRCEPAGEQLAAGGAGVWSAGGRGDGRGTGARRQVPGARKCGGGCGGQLE